VINAEAGVGPRFRVAYGITVPVDDENCLFYVSEHVPLNKAEAEAYHHKFGDIMDIRNKKPTAFEVALQIRTTTASVTDFADHPVLVAVEDLSAQGAQGAIVDRRAELLGRTDKGIVFMRRIWQRELQALSEGRPTNDWKFLSNPPKGSFG
jgi:5,5'-dehydrodivanillate O-demethylase